MEHLVTNKIGEITLTAKKVAEDIKEIVEDTSELIKEVKPPLKILDNAKKIISNYYDQKYKMIPLMVLSKRLRISYSKISEIVNCLEQEGFLSKVGNRYKLAGYVDNNTNTTFIKKMKRKAKVSPGMFFLKLIVFIIGCGATYMSIFHSIEFLKDYYDPLKAIIAATLIISFNIVSAEMIIFGIIHKLKMIIAGFAIILFLGSVFSMGSTIIGLYNLKANTTTTQNININNNDTEYRQRELKHKLLVEEKEQIKKLLDGEIIKRDGLVTLLNNFSQEQIKLDLENYNKINGRRYIADKRIDKLQNDFNKILNVEKEYIKSNIVFDSNKKELPPDAYDWIAKYVFKNMNADGIKFWMSVYPAIFYDIIAPISFSIVFFLTGNFKIRKTRKIKKRGKRK